MLFYFHIWPYSEIWTEVDPWKHWKMFIGIWFEYLILSLGSFQFFWSVMNWFCGSEHQILISTQFSDMLQVLLIALSPQKIFLLLIRQLLLTDSPHISLLVVCEEVWLYEGILTSWFVNKFAEGPYHFKPFFMPVNFGSVRYCFVNCSVSPCSVSGPYFYPLSQKKMFVFIPTSWLSISWSVHLPP